MSSIPTLDLGDSTLFTERTVMFSVIFIYFSAYGPMHQFVIGEKETQSLYTHKREDRSFIHSRFHPLRSHQSRFLYAIMHLSFLASPAMRLLLLPCPRRHLVTLIPFVEVLDLGR
jgi:hypothetical protein